MVGVKQTGGILMNCVVVHLCMCKLCFPGTPFQNIGPLQTISKLPLDGRTFGLSIGNLMCTRPSSGSWISRIAWYSCAQQVLCIVCDRCVIICDTYRTFGLSIGNLICTRPSSRSWISRCAMDMLKYIMR